MMCGPRRLLTGHNFADRARVEWRKVKAFRLPGAQRKMWSGVSQFLAGVGPHQSSGETRYFSVRPSVQARRRGSKRGSISEARKRIPRPTSINGWFTASALKVGKSSGKWRLMRANQQHPGILRTTTPQRLKWQTENLSILILLIKGSSPTTMMVIWNGRERWKHTRLDIIGAVQPHPSCMGTPFTLLMIMNRIPLSRPLTKRQDKTYGAGIGMRRATGRPPLSGKINWGLRLLLLAAARLALTDLMATSCGN